MKAKMEENYSLIGVDSNAFAILGYVSKAMRKEKRSSQEIEEYIKNAKSNDYSHLLLVSQQMIEKLNSGE